MLQRMFHALGCCLPLLLVSACGQSGEALLDDYTGRVANVLDADPPPLSDRALPAYPRTRELRQTPPDIRINLLEAWSLRGCEVFVLLGERNSILGRVADPVIRLDYERRLLRLLPECLDSEVDLDPELHDELERVLAAKREAFALFVWNATLASPDYSGYWTGGNTPFAAADDIDAAGYGAAQGALADLVADPLDSNRERWLATLERVAEYPMGGHSLQSMRLAMRYLEQSERMLERAARDARLCPMGPALPELGYARNVMTNVFISEVQPWLVTVDQRFLAGHDALVAMTEVLPVDNRAMDAYVRELTDWHQAYRAAIRRQVEAWQRLFEACGDRAAPAG